MLDKFGVSVDKTVLELVALVDELSIEPEIEEVN